MNQITKSEREGFDALLSALKIVEGMYVADQPVEYYAGLAEIPDWDRGGEVHNWRTYIESSIKSYWDGFPLLTRIYMIILAKSQAYHEEWD